MKLLRSLAGFALCVCATPAMGFDFNAPIVADPIESGDGWVTPPIHWASSISGLTPSAGSEFWGSATNTVVTIGMSKDFVGVQVQPGSYRLRIDVSQPNPSGPPVVDSDPVPYADFAAFGLTGISSGVTVVSAVTPPDSVAQWTTWEFEYTVPNGSPDVGNTLGFEMSYTNPPNNSYSVMIDNLRVAYVPEPGSLVVVGVMGLASLRRRR